MEKLKAEADALADQAALNVKNKETTAVPTDPKSPDVIDVSAGEDKNSISVDAVNNKETTAVPTDTESPDVIDVSAGEDKNSVSLDTKNKESTAVPTDPESPDGIDVSAGEDKISVSVDDAKESTVNNGIVSKEDSETTAVLTTPESPDAIDVSAGKDTNSKSVDDAKKSTVNSGIVSKEDTTLTIKEKTTKKRKRFTPAPDDTGPTTMPKVLIDASTNKPIDEKAGAIEPKTGSKDSDVLFVDAAIASAEANMMSSTKPTPLVKAARPHIHSPQSKYFREWNMGERETEAL